MSSSAARYDIAVDRGSDWSKTLSLLDVAGDPVPIVDIHVADASIAGTLVPGATGALQYVSAELWTTDGNASAPVSGTWIRVRRSASVWQIHHFVNAVASAGYWTADNNPEHPAWVTSWTAIGGATGNPEVDSDGFYFEGAVSLLEQGPAVASFTFDTVGDGTGGQVDISLSRIFTHALSSRGAYKFDWFAFRGRERLRLVYGKLSARGSSTLSGSTVSMPGGPGAPAVAATSFVALTDGATADIPTINTPLSAALAGKQPLDSDLTAIAALTTATFGRSLLTLSSASAGRTALELGTLATQSGTFSGTHSGTSSGTNTGDQSLAGLIPRLSQITITTIEGGTEILTEEPTLTLGKRQWTGGGGELAYDGANWNLRFSDGLSDFYAASYFDATDEPWKLTGWTITTGSVAPTFDLVDPVALLPVNGATGTMALAADQQGRVAPTDMTGLGTGVATALAINAGTAGAVQLNNGSAAGLTSIPAGQLTGDVAVARIATALTTPGPIGGTTPAAISGTTGVFTTSGTFGPSSNWVVAADITAATPGGSIQLSGVGNVRFGGAGDRLYNSGGAIKIRNAANTLDAALTCSNLTASGYIAGTPQALSGAGAVNITALSTAYTSTGGAQALTLANSSVNGQLKTISHVSDGGSGVLTPTTANGFTTITFTNTGDSVTLQWNTTGGWCIVGIFGAVAA